MIGTAAKVYSPNGVDIGHRLVSAGVVYRRYSTDYVAAEDEASKARLGIWRCTLVEILGAARIGTAVARAANSFGSRRQAAESGS